MTVEIWTEATQFLSWEYINQNFFAVQEKNKHKTLLFYEREFCLAYMYVFYNFITNNKLCHKD